MFAWTDFLDLARVLAASPDESSQRSAVSRAYYAAFHAARVLVESDEGLPVAKTGGAHEYVWRRLEEGAKGRRRIGQMGKRLKESRRKADYDDVVSGFSAVATQTVKDTDDLIRLVTSESVTATPTAATGPAPPSRK